MLVRDELKLAQLEMTRKGKQAGVGIGTLGSGGLVALYGVGCLLAAAIIAIAGAVSAWLAALIVRRGPAGWSAGAARCWARAAAEGRAAGPGGGRRQHQDRCRGDQGKGAAMTSSDSAPASHRPGTPLTRIWPSELRRPPAPPRPPARARQTPGSAPVR